MNRQGSEHNRFFTLRTWILLGLAVFGAIVALYRLAVGLGPATNLSDSTPWGLWIAFDVTTGVALAAGGFTVTFAAYVANWDKFKPIARAATLTAFLGYLLVVFGVFLDIGKPFSIWHPIFFWQPGSVMFEIVICISLYTTVLFLEFLPWLLDRLNVLTGVRDFLEKRSVLFTLVILGIMLSYGHQSSLGGLFLITPAKLHPLWYTQFIHHLFFLSAVCVGLSMVSCETIVSANMRNKEHETGILEGLARGTAIALLVYFLVRFADLAIKGNIGAMFEGSPQSGLFLLEIGVGVVLPMILLASKSIRSSIPALLASHGMVIFGVLLNRLNVVFLTQNDMGAAAYFPSWQEFAITVGLVSAGLFLYKLIVTYLPIFSPAEQQS